MSMTLKQQEEATSAISFIVQDFYRQMFSGGVARRDLGEAAKTLAEEAAVAIRAGYEKLNAPN